MLIIIRPQPLGSAGFIKPNIGDSVDSAVGQTMKLFTQPTAVVEQ
jgi:hypothetical protein